VGYSSGDLNSGAIGTVTYVDGDRMWGFGHPLDSVGRRDLFLQGAYVYDIVNNPLGIADITTYKLAAPTQDIGTLLGDGIDAVTGRTGPLPDSFPLTVFALDQDTGNRVVLRSQVADETGVGNPSGASPVSGLAAIATGQATYEVLRGSPARQSGSLCMHITVAERAKPMGFCNTYVGGVPGQAGVVGLPSVSDVSQAIDLLDGYQLGPLHLKSVALDLRARRGLAQAFLVGLRGPHLVRRGHTYRYTAVMRRVGGAALTRTIRVHVSRGVHTGFHELVLHGTAADSSGAPSESDLSIILGFDDSGSSGGGGAGGPRSIKALAHQIAQIHRYDGVTADFRAAGLESRRRVYRDPSLRISGTERFGVLVRR